jgi:acyl-CoA thioester hydrolase
VISPIENPIHRHAGIIAFGETDASGWMHFPNVFNYVEAAEHDYLRKQGVVVFDREGGGWPRVKVSCDYKQPFLSGDGFEVLLGISKIGASSMQWDFQVLNAAEEIAAFGSMTCVRVDHHGKPVLITDDERLKLGGGTHLA